MLAETGFLYRKDGPIEAVRFGASLPLPTSGDRPYLFGGCMSKESRRIVFNCGTCGREVEDYISNRPPTKTGKWFCSFRCAGIGRRKVLSLANGGDGIPRPKSEKDAIYYTKHLSVIRDRTNDYYKDNRLNILEKKRRGDRELKRKVMDAYGGKCVCCGESILEFLTIDHINGDGFLHRRKVGKGRRIYADLLMAGCPKDNYRILCFNCNITRGFYGYCPHHPEDRQELNHTFGQVTGRVGRPITIRPFETVLCQEREG